jgi:hypothetical protein
METDVRMTMEKGFAEVKGRLDEGNKRFDRVERKIDARAAEHTKLETEMLRLRADHDLLDRRVATQDIAIETCMGVVDRIETRDKERRSLDDTRHQGNLASIDNLTVKVNALVNKPQPAFLSPDMPITIKFVLWLGGVLLVGGNAVVVWYTVIRPMFGKP